VGRLEGALRRVEQGAATKSAVDGLQVICTPARSGDDSALILIWYNVT
jgi:hypothetical protein